MTTQNPLILSFDQIRASDLPLVGGKGANLGEMTHAAFPIPQGFCLTTVAFQQFIESYPEMARLYGLLETVTSDDVETARQVGQEVRQALLEVAMPPKIADSVREYWQKVGTAHAYAVRSSATAEDLPDASFAGQQDTYLNVIGEEALLDAIRSCWVSLFTDRAILYRCQNHFSHQEVQLSVVVQQMVMSEKSGILFTADPLTGHRHTTVIDASFGLGEALVSGIVSPDAYHVDKRTNTIIERQIADKQIAIFPEKEGGTRQEKLSDEQRAATVLSDSQILSLTDLGSRVEAHYGSPQDIEWAIADDKLYLLQARPITSLYPIEGFQSPDDTLHIFFSMGHQQNMTNAMSPMSISVVRCFVPIGRDSEHPESTFIRANGGRIFIDLTQPLRHPIFKHAAFNASAMFDSLAPKAMKKAMQRPEFKAKHGMRIPFWFIKGFWKNAYHTMSNVFVRDLTGTVDKVNAIIDGHIAKIKNDIHTAPTDEAKIQAIIDAMHALFPVIFKWVPDFLAGEIAKRMLARIARDWADPQDIEAVSLGLLGNAVTDMNLELGDVADKARQSPQLMDLFSNLGDDGQAFLAQAAQIEDSTAFMEAWKAFIAKYGARGSAEIDIMQPRWYEEPLPILQVIASHLKGEKGSHRIQHKKLVEARERATERLLNQSKQGMGGWLRGRIVRRLLYVIREISVLREHHKYMAVRAFSVIKEDIKTMAVSLAENKKLSQADDIWFLSLPELLKLLHGDDFDIKALIAKRKAAFALYQKMTPPLVITSDGESPVVTFEVEDAPEGALLGNPVSAGIVEGIVHVIHDPQIETLQPGEILVAPFTDPGWTPLFINAGGLIMEVGGIMTHGSVVAREYGIPAVVGVRDATKTLQTGQHVRIDGNRGVIEIL